MKAFKAPQRSVKIKFNLIFSLPPGLGLEGLRISTIDLLTNMKNINFMFEKKQKTNALFHSFTVSAM